jgi:hypothetical protein
VVGSKVKFGRPNCTEGKMYHTTIITTDLIIVVKVRYRLHQHKVHTLHHTVMMQ